MRYQLTMIIQFILFVAMLLQSSFALGNRFESGYPCFDDQKTCEDKKGQIVDGVYIEPNCWEYSYVKTCNYPSKDDCKKYVGCYAVATLECLLTDSIGNCVNRKKEFSCKSWTPVTLENQTVRMDLVEKDGQEGLVCKGVPCIDGNCVDKSYMTNGEMMDSVSKLYAVSKMQPDKDGNFCLFQGSDEHCSKKATGYSNCCPIDNNGWGSKIGAGCTPDEKHLMEQRAKNLCVYVGKQNKGIMKTVVKHQFCCFSTMLDKVIQVEGRKQLGMDFGSAGNANCRGLTLEEIQKLDFSKMDFSEFIEDFKLKFAGRYKSPKPGELGGIANSSQLKLRRYDGNPNNQINNMTGWQGDARDDSWEAEEEERQRLAKLEAERLERERLEKERLAKLEAERLERERLARLEAERKERERLAKLEAERLERERLAKSKNAETKLASVDRAIDLRPLLTPEIFKPLTSAVDQRNPKIQKDQIKHAKQQVKEKYALLKQQNPQNVKQLDIEEKLHSMIHERRLLQFLEREIACLNYGILNIDNASIESNLRNRKVNDPYKNVNDPWLAVLEELWNTYQQLNHPSSTLGWQIANAISELRGEMFKMVTNKTEEQVSKISLTKEYLKLEKDIMSLETMANLTKLLEPNLFRPKLVVPKMDVSAAIARLKQEKQRIVQKYELLKQQIPEESGQLNMEKQLNELALDREILRIMELEIISFGMNLRDNWDGYGKNSGMASGLKLSANNKGYSLWSHDNRKVLFFELQDDMKLRLEKLYLELNNEQAQLKENIRSKESKLELLK